MPISTSMAVVVYFTIWWIVLFAVLPWGVHSQDETGDGRARERTGRSSGPETPDQGSLDHGDLGGGVRLRSDARSLLR